LWITAPTVLETQAEVMTRNTPDLAVRTGGEKWLGPPGGHLIRGAGFKMAIDRGRTIRGVIRDRDTHTPIAGMRVYYNRGGLSRLPGVGPYNFMATSDADGRFAITGLYAGRTEAPKKDSEKDVVTAISPPGMVYRTTMTEVKADADVVIEAARGIPFRLTVVDEQGRPVEGEVFYTQLFPGTRIADTEPAGRYSWSSPIGPAAARGGGVYEGFALPGSGAVVVKTPERRDVVAPRVDPQDFFAPDGLGPTNKNEAIPYGTTESLTGCQGWVHQAECAAIVLIKVQEDSGPLELKATVLSRIPRVVTVVDADGQPVVGLKTQGMTPHPYDHEPRLRAASFKLFGLHPQRWRRITFTDEDRSLIGQLAARGDGDSPYTVRLQKWGTLSGRLVDAYGNPLKDTRLGDPSAWSEENLDPALALFGGAKTDDSGQFRLERLVPGLKYTAVIYAADGKTLGTAFENLTLNPGETRDLGPLRIIPPQLVLLNRH
jgi:hypothetical protein